MPATRPLFAREATAARLLDMRPQQFRRLVEAGALPSPCNVMGEERYDVAELEATMRGAKPKLNEGFEL